MFCVFHILGNLPEVSERVKSLASDGAMLLAVALSIKAEIPSGPFIDEMQNYFRCYLLLPLHMGTGYYKLPQIEEVLKSSSNLQKCI